METLEARRNQGTSYYGLQICAWAGGGVDEVRRNGWGWWRCMGHTNMLSVIATRRYERCPTEMCSGVDSTCFASATVFDFIHFLWPLLPQKAIGLWRSQLQFRRRQDRSLLSPLELQNYKCNESASRYNGFPPAGLSISLAHWYGRVTQLRYQLPRLVIFSISMYLFVLAITITCRHRLVFENVSQPKSPYYCKPVTLFDE